MKIFFFKKKRNIKKIMIINYVDKLFRKKLCI